MIHFIKNPSRVIIRSDRSINTGFKKTMFKRLGQHSQGQLSYNMLLIDFCVHIQHATVQSNTLIQECKKMFIWEKHLFAPLHVSVMYIKKEERNKFLLTGSKTEHEKVSD